MKVLLALEGKDDVRRIPQLFDWWLEAEVEWFSPEHPEACREFIGLDAGGRFVSIKSITRLRKQLVRGGFGGKHPSGDAGTFADLLIVIEELELAPDIVVWVRDEDGVAERAADMRAEVEARGEGERFVVGYARQTSDAWVLVGWDAREPVPKSFGDQTSRKLPRDAHKFTHRNQDGGVKWALRLLFDDHERQDQVLGRAWGLPDEDIEACGLAGFRRALDDHPGLRRALGLGPKRS